MSKTEETQVHERWHPLLKIHILNSPHRLGRKWIGAREAKQVQQLPEYDPECQFCPGVTRASGEKNPIDPSEYPFEFTNDCQAILPLEGPIRSQATSDRDKLYKQRNVYGACRVVNFHPKHNLNLALMPENEGFLVFKLWRDLYIRLGGLDYVKTVNIFENNRFGSSQPHPHNQIWCSSEVAPYLEQVLAASREYQRENRTCLFCETVERELEGPRLLYQNEDFAAFVPYWAIWPFETWIVAKKHKSSLDDLSDIELQNLFLAYNAVNTRLDNLFEALCPYSSGIYQKPTDGNQYPEAHLHIIFRPPVVRNVDVFKWMVGYEFMAQPQRDIPPERAAELLKSKPDVHFLRR